MNKLNDKLLVPQKLGYVGLCILLIAISTFAAISLDMFSPSLPAITADFGAKESEASLTLTLFFFFYAVGMLFLGPLSDKYGRKPVLVLSLGGFVLGSILCAVSVNIPMLLLARIIEALGGGGASAVGTALLKDVFKPDVREKFLLFMAVMQVIGPIAAPLVGGVIAKYSVWNMSFVILSVLGAVCFGFSFLFNETLPKEDRIQEGVLVSYKHLFMILRDGSFTTFLILAIMPNIAFGGLLSVGSYIYINEFGLSETAFGLWMAFISAFGIIGPAIYTKLVGILGKKNAITVMLVAPVLTGILELTIGRSAPLAFALAFAPAAIAAAAIRPCMTAILLQQNDKDAGSASGIINFSCVISGTIGMAFTAMFKTSFIIGIGVLSFVATFIAVILWVIFLKTPKLQLKALDK